MAIVRRNLWNLDLACSAAPRIEVADTVWKRSVGLIGRRSLESGSGLWIAPCNGIHTLFMRFAIDVIFLNEAGEVIHLAPSLKPWRIFGPILKSCVVIELPAGTIERSGIKLGTRLMLNNAEEPAFPLRTRE
jgi:uncharacterized membrane protein (UPF0127 family)